MSLRNDFNISTHNKGRRLLEWQLLALTPLLALTSTLFPALAIAVLFSITALISNLAISLLSGDIKATWRFPCYLAVLSITVTVLQLFLQNYSPALMSGLGIYLPLLSCSMALLLQMELHAYKQAPVSALKHALILSGGFLLICLVLGVTRELLATGSIFNQWQEVFSSLSADELPEFTFAWHFPTTVPASFIIAGLVLALLQSLTRLRQGKSGNELPRVKRARITERS